MKTKKKSIVRSSNYVHAGGLTHRQIAVIMGLSHQRVEQIEKTALAKLAKSGKARILKQFLRD